MGKRMDLTGETYGRLRVIKEVDSKGYTRRWLCECSCGESEPIIVTHSNLRGGHTTSCGCMQKEAASKSNGKDLTNRVFGRLIVARRAPRKFKNRKVHWICECQCGNTVEVSSDKLLGGETRSCGCLRVEGGKKLAAYNKEHLTNDEGVFIPSLQRKTREDNASDHKGICLRDNGNYSVRIGVNNTNFNLGTYDDLTRAIRVRKLAEIKFHAPHIRLHDAQKRELVSQIFSAKEAAAFLNVSRETIIHHRNIGNIQTIDGLDFIAFWKNDLIRLKPKLNRTYTKKGIDKHKRKDVKK